MLIAGHKCIRRGIESLQNHGLCHFLTNRCSRTYSSPAIKKVIFSGIQPTGVPHIGNYLGALKQWVNLQKESSPTIKLFFSIVDLHAITVRQDPEQLRLWRKETLATLLAVGLDPARVTIFYQSDVKNLSFMCMRGILCLTNSPAGSCTCGVDVDPELHGFHRIPFTDDTMEGIRMLILLNKAFAFAFLINK